jgi:hypothetical protein
VKNVRVHWEPPSIRGRHQLPPTRRYVVLSRFPEDGPNWSDGQWSVEIFFTIPPPEQVDSRMSEGKARFLVDGAPHDRLASGRWFSIYEGPQKVAEVEVL